MAKTDEMQRLFRAITQRDWDTAQDIAQSICEAEAKKGHQQSARRLRGALNPNGRINGALNGHARPDVAQPLLQALAPIQPEIRFEDLQLRKKSRAELSKVISEWTHRDFLSKRGLRPRNRLFFHGPPGCGKSATAAALGAQLSLPTYLIRFDAVIGAYLGQTAIHLRQLFDFSERTAAVLVFDELDALGKQRGNPLDVGELDRIVIALMQELEHANPAGLIVATSNLPKNIDDALWRRFDLEMQFPSPSKAERARYGQELSRTLGQRFSAPLKRKVEMAKSYAEVKKTLLTEARRIALEDV